MKTEKKHSLRRSPEQSHQEDGVVRSRLYSCNTSGQEAPDELALNLLSPSLLLTSFLAESKGVILLTFRSS